MTSAEWLIDQLVQQGVTRFCIAPGSRSTPLALAAADHPKTEILVHFDERGLGFYALGYGMGAKRPAALIVTSGTAVANLAPSVCEAHHSFVPMILLTADRPSELRDCSANQTTDQAKFFSSFVRWHADLPPTLHESYFRSIAAQAVFASLANPPGPVHLNCQFREPLYEKREMQIANCKMGVEIPFVFPRLIAAPPPCKTSRGLIFIGRLPSSPKPILDLAERLQWPVCADILSNARCTPTPTQIRHFQPLFQNQSHPTPDLILHFGERLTCKYLTHLRCPIIHISPYPALQDPFRKNPTRIQSDIEPFCAQFSAPTDPSWLPQWQALDIPPTPSTPESQVFQSLKIPPNYAIFLGNSTPIYDADRFLFPPTCRGFYANRGLSGIDGNIATVAGLSDALHAPLLALLGDQTCLHDLNSFPLLKNRSVLLLILNNYGGGLFSRFPVSESPHFESLFKAAHCWTFQPIAQMFDLPYTSTQELTALPPSGILELQIAPIPALATN